MSTEPTIGNFFDLEKFHLDDIVNELFDPNKLGGLSIPGFLIEQLREELSDEVRFGENTKGLYRRAPREYGVALQRSLL